jgi:hypothetical protein
MPIKTQDPIAKWESQKAATRTCEKEIREALTKFVGETGLDPYYVNATTYFEGPKQELKVSVVVYGSDPVSGCRIRLDEEAKGPNGG